MYNNNVLLFHGDCLDKMKDIADESIDMVLCDLPYNETGNKWDKKINIPAVLKEYIRIIRNDGCIALTGSFRFGVKIFNEIGSYYKYDWIWQKENGTNAPNVNFQPFRVHEYIFIYGKGRVTNGSRVAMKYNPQKTPGYPYRQKSGKQSDNWKGGLKNIVTNNESGLRYPITVQKFNRDKEKYHPTQKPVALLEYLIKTYSNENDVVLDNTMGSGSTGVAAINTNRCFIGIEKDDDYYKIATKRINDAIAESNNDLFKLKNI